MPPSEPRKPGAGAALDLLVAGHTNLDHFLEVRRLPERDRTVPILSVHTELGGTAANIAIAAAREGLRVGLISRVGSDFPKEFRRRLRSEPVDLRGLEIVATEASPNCFIVHAHSGDQVTLIDQGPMEDARSARVAAELFRPGTWLHLTTGDPRFQLRIQAEARERGVRIASDPAQEIFYRWTARTFRALVAGSEILFGNEAEIAHAAKLLGEPGPAGILRHVPLIVATRGRRGAVAYSRRETRTVPAVALSPARRAVGAGDAFRGGFYAGWLNGWPLRDCLRRATRAAARWMTQSRTPGGRRLVLRRSRPRRTVAGPGRKRA